MEKVRYLNKRFNSNERENYSRWWKEQINHYGTSVTYYTNNYSLVNHNFLYGEDSTSNFTKADDLVMLTDITNDSLMLSKFGIMADCDMTAVIHISAFYEKFGCGTEPKAGDLIQLTEYGADRPGGRMAPIYEITERDDEYLPMTNPLIGHYVWYIKCKRFEYSYESGVPNGPNNKQPSDGGAYGVLEPVVEHAPLPTETFLPTRTPHPTRTPGPTRTPIPTPVGNEPTVTPGPTETPYSTETPEPTQTPQPTPVPRAPQIPPETLFQPYPDSVQNSAKCIYDYYDQRNAGLDRNLTHYISPQVPDCDLSEIKSFADVPGPYAQQATFTSQDATTLQNLTYLASHQDNIALRSVLSSDEDTKTFEVSTMGDSADKLIYIGQTEEAYVLTDLLKPTATTTSTPTPTPTPTVPSPTPNPTATYAPGILPPTPLPTETLIATPTATAFLWPPTPPPTETLIP